VNNTTHHALVADQPLWTTQWQAIAHSRIWFMSFLAVGAFSSVIYPHPPLVAFGAIAGTTLKPKPAILVAMLIWLLNQVYGYTLRQYPWTAGSLLWGLMMGLGILVVTLLASLRPPFSQKTVKGHCLWFGAVALIGFTAFESLILALDWLLTGSHILAWAITRSLLIKEGVWAIGLMLMHLSLTRFTRPVH